MRKVLIVSILGLSLAIVGCGKNNNAVNNISEENQIPVDVSAVAEELEPLKPTTNWVYSESTDEMRGIDSRFASIDSDNQVQFDFPYDGGSNLRITLRKKTGESPEVMFVVSKGQYSCDTISDNCYASIKFDNKAVENIALASTSDYSSDVLFIKYDTDINEFIRSLSKAKAVIIELPFYQEGAQQFKFSPSGLNWNIPKIKKIKSDSISVAVEAAEAAIDAAEAAAAAAVMNEPEVTEVTEIEEQ